MDALNFLSQQPTLNWMDFYLEPSKLIPHLSQRKPEPSEDQLIAQFCEQAKLADQLALTELIPEHTEYARTKAKKLWCLTFTVCSHLNWNLKTLRKKCHMVHLKSIIQEFCGLVMGTTDFASILRNNDHLGIVVPMKLLISTQILCARCILDSIRHDAFPTLPPKITVSNPSAQVDPSLPLLEAKTAVIQELRSVAELAVEFLQNSTNDGNISGEQYAIPKASSFVYSSGISQEMVDIIVETNWNEMEQLSPQLAYLQCTYDLGEHYFFRRQFKEARRCMKTVWSELQMLSQSMHDHFTLDRNSVVGYCHALKIDTGSEENANVAQQESLVSKHAEEEKNISQKSLAKFAQLRSKNFISSLNHLNGVMEGDITFLRRPENATTFCLALKNQVSSKISRRKRTILLAYLKFLCSCHPPLLETLKGCGVLERLQCSESALRFTNAALKKDVAPDLSLLSRLEPPWHVLFAVDPTELKSNAQRTSNRVSAHFYVPDAVQPVVQKLAKGIYQDLVALAACKAQQLTYIGATSAVPALLEMASREARSGLGETAPEFQWELIRLDLIRWHNLLHRCSDVQRMGRLTNEVGAKVRSFILSCGPKGGPAPTGNWELYMLLTSFLLNSCDWEGILLSPSFHRFANFGKVLASLCYEVSKGSVNVRTVAREFFDIMLPTMMDTVQYKRGAGGTHLSVVRESPAQLLSRANFIAIVKNIKEPSAISLLMAFFVKLYNGMKGGIVEIYSEHLGLWPASFVDATGVNEPFLKEILLLTLENALLVNPNNAFWLRARGDFELANDRLIAALQFYLQCLLACSDGFTKPLPENVVDDKLIMNMVKCCGRLECHTLEALLCQLLREPNYGLALKALQESTTYDGIDAYFGMIWDPALLELLTYVLEKSNQQHGRLENAMRVYLQQDNNVHNDESILNSVTSRRRKAFLTAMCRLFF